MHAVQHLRDGHIVCRGPKRGTLLRRRTVQHAVVIPRRTRLHRRGIADLHLVLFLFLFALAGLALSGGRGGGHGRNGHHFSAEAVLGPRLGGEAGGHTLAHHVGLVLQGGILHHREAACHPALGLLDHMGQLMAQHIHAGALIQQDIGALGYRLNPHLLRDMTPADADIGKVRAETRLKLLPQLGGHGLRRSGAGQVKHLAPGGRRLLDGRNSPIRGLAFCHMGLHVTRPPSQKW